MSENEESKTSDKENQWSNYWTPKELSWNAVRAILTSDKKWGFEDKDYGLVLQVLKYEKPK